MSDMANKSKCSYKLRVNINGFLLSEIKVSVELQPKLRVKIVAKQAEAKSEAKHSEKSCKQYVKYYDISSTANVIPASMQHYLDPTNPLYLIIEFDSNCDESVFVNLDDSCESLVEMAAKSLLNVKNIDTLRHSIENPHKVNSNTNQSLAEVFSTSIIKDLNSATTTSFTETKKVINSDGSKVVKININVPAKITSAGLASDLSTSLLKENKYNILDLSNESAQKNHLFIRFDNLNLFLEANTVDNDTTSFFSKQIKVPKGTRTKELTYKLDNVKHLITIEMPFCDL